MTQLNIAVVGSGVAGLSAAWLLSGRHRVTLYETDNRLGGHAKTVTVTTPDGPVAVDTGFIVYNERNYPNLTALFRFLGVETATTEMSFALSLDGGAYEYASNGLNGYFGQRRNIASPGHWRQLNDISRFFRSAEERVLQYPDDTSLGVFLQAEGYSRWFIRNHITPMGAAIWSTTMEGMLDFPARSFIDFYANHGMLQFRDRPGWRTVAGGSQNYVARLVAGADMDVHKGLGVERVTRHANHVLITDKRGVTRPFDHVVIATHADQALGLLGDASSLETGHLSRFAYQRNRAVLHRDPRWMPKRRRLWSSWNYLRPSGGAESGLCVSYWMNRLQDLPTRSNLFVTLNPPEPIHPKAVDAVVDYDHPVFDAAAIEAQKSLWQIQGRNRTWFCGSYFGYGFHEDAVASGLKAAEQLGGIRRPWRLDDQSADGAWFPVPGVEAAE